MLEESHDLPNAGSRQVFRRLALSRKDENVLYRDYNYKGSIHLNLFPTKNQVNFRSSTREAEAQKRIPSTTLMDRFTLLAPKPKLSCTQDLGFRVGFRV